MQKFLFQSLLLRNLIYGPLSVAFAIAVNLVITPLSVKLVTIAPSVFQKVVEISHTLFSLSLIFFFWDLYLFNSSTDILAHFWREELYACVQSYKKLKFVEIKVYCAFSVRQSISIKDIK